MKVSTSHFDMVFDGQSNFVPRAILDLNRVDVPEVRDLMRHAEHGEDGLDHYDTVPMILHMDCGDTRRFALWRHAHNPAGHVAIKLPLDEEFQDALKEIMQIMQIPASALVWLDQPIASTKIRPRPRR
jgi:hypothetical protein